MAKKKKPDTKEEIQAQNEMPKGSDDAASTVDEKADISFPIVGIGASAGGLAAFEAFFSGMPTDTDPGMAFVLVQHLAPDHKSILTDLVKRYTRMQVFETVDGMKVMPNCVYIIPPNCDMAFINGMLQLLKPSEPRGHRQPIDFFFRSLAQDQCERAICIVLSGTGSDGTLGVRAIKGEGGMAMAQNQESAEYNGMPASAISTGFVDYVLPPEEMPAQIIAYVAHSFGKSTHDLSAQFSNDENALNKIFVLLRAKSGHDFSKYKPSTINRRIARRMALHHIETMDGYVKYMQQSAEEAEVLFRDLLIGVTSFFRDPVAFKALEEQIIPKLFADKPAGAAVRVWSPGCSTGEEAYSIAILLHERMESLKQSYKVQVFATDIDGHAVSTARSGVYPAGIAADISPGRLARFFTPESDGGAYRIKKVIRDMIVFSEHNVIKDPPFSKLDLISCRNLMIYLGAELQKKVLPLFHYAMNPGGMLFLGTSETVGEFMDLFSTLDYKSKLYLRKGDFSRNMAPELLFRPLPEGGAAPRTSKNTDAGASESLRELTERALLKQVYPTGALVNAHGDILYVHGRTGRFLEMALGDAGVSNILKMVREGMQRELTMALRKAVATKEIVLCPGLRVKTNGDFTTVNLTVMPVAPAHGKSKQELFLVIFEETQSLEHERPAVAGDSAADDDPAISALRQELRAKEEYLAATTEQLQTTIEELKSTNEEMQSINEEMQSTNEELETSKEELQSVNEELATVNCELEAKMDYATGLNNDMNNLLAGTGIATVFVDLKMNILRFTPTATKIINLMNSDAGRPLMHFVTNLTNYDRLLEDAQDVIESLIPMELEVKTRNGDWYSMRIRPYRTLDNLIQGLTISFLEISKEVALRDKLQESMAVGRLAVVVRDSHDAVTVQDLNGRILAWNPAAERMYGWSEAEALAMNFRDLIPEGLREESLDIIIRLGMDEVLKPYRFQRIAKGGRIVEIWLTATALKDEAGKIYGVSTTERAYVTPQVTS